MKDLSQVEYHQLSEEIVNILSKKTLKKNYQFFRTQVAYYLGKVASMMRCYVQTSISDPVPVNIYAINLAPSGSGKGHSTNIIENSIIKGFQKEFMDSTFEAVAKKTLAILACDRANKYNSDPDEVLKKLEAEYLKSGNMLFSFDSATPAAIKQLRHKLLLAGVGSICLEIDEIGSNLLGNTDVINTFLELYDVGSLKPKLVKSTVDNTRNEELTGQTPTNTLWFGTPNKLMDSDKVEEALNSFLETGYARRCIVGYTRTNEKYLGLTSQETIDLMNDPALTFTINTIANVFTKLADISNFGKLITISRPVEELLIEYKTICENLSEEMKEHEEMRKSEMAHRYFKVLKLAGAYAFVDGTPEITEEQLYAAIKLVEDSGENFRKLLSRDKAYVKVAKYIADVSTQVTYADMAEDLPFFPKTNTQIQTLMNLAIAWGYKNNVIIKKSFESGIEFLSGETIKETNLDKMLISYSKDLAAGYVKREAPFFGMKNFLMRNDYHFITHALKTDARNEDNIINGFNLLVLDVDGTSSLNTAQLLLKDHLYIMYTTKSHSAVADRFRILLPMSHTLKLDAAEFKEFMDNIYQWLPFDVDTTTAQRSRKWRTWNGNYFENRTGELFNVLPFIPKTSQNEERKKRILDTQSLTNLERWFVDKTGNGNRNHQLLKYALLLVDQGYDYHSVLSGVQSLNSKIQDPISDTEILSTIMTTASKRIGERTIGNDE